MNLGRVRHLLGFELKRIKWLVVAAWVFLAMAFVPRLADALGRWNLEWDNAEEFFATTGGVGFGLAGFFLAIWSGLVGRKLFPGRPVLAGEIRVVSLGVLLGVLVLPVVFLTLVSLWLYGFSGEVISRGVGMTALATLPLWLGVRFFASYAGSLKMTVVGLVVVGCLMTAGESFGYRQLMTPWANVLGSWPGDYRWVATLVAVILMAGAWLFARRWGVLPRLSVGVLSVVAGLAAMDWIASERKMAAFQNEFSETVKVKGKIWGFRSGGKAQLTYEVSEEREEGMMVWEVLDSLKDEKGRIYKRNEVGLKEIPVHQIERAGMNLIAMSLLEEGQVFLDEGTFHSAKFGRALHNLNTRRIELLLPRDYLAGEAVRLSGRLAGRHCFVDTLVKDLPIGESAEFRRGDVVGEMSWQDGEYEGDPREMRVVVREPLSLEGFENRWKLSRDQNWLVLMKYPKAGVVVEGDSSSSGGDEEIGGVKRWTKRYRFVHSELRKYDLKGEMPVISIYRVRVEECGFAEVDSEPIVLLDKDEGGKRSDYWTMLYGARNGDGPLPTDQWGMRPDPERASREEVGGWFREIADRHNYAARDRDLAQFAERWGDLFWKTMTQAGERSRIGPRPFINGTTNDWQAVANQELDGVVSSAWTLVERGWDRAAQGEVTRLIQEGNREPEILRLGILLELEGIEDAVIEGLLVNDRWELYEAARIWLKLGDRIEGILDERLKRAEEVTGRSWFLSGKDYNFTSLPWLWLLHEGRKKDLERCLMWMRKAHACENYGFVERDHNQPRRFESLLFGYKEFRDLGKAGKLQAEFFDWDPVLRRWIFNEKGKVK